MNYIPLTALFLWYTIPAPFVLSRWQPSHLLLSYVPEEDAFGIHMLARTVNHEATTKELLPQYMLKALDFILLQWGRCVVTLPYLFSLELVVTEERKELYSILIFQTLLTLPGRRTVPI